MEHLAHSAEFLQKRKFYTYLPLLALPFLTFIYWVLVVKNLNGNNQAASSSIGLQLSLPAANLEKDNGMDKLAFYKKADQDSANWIKQIKRDPYRLQENLTAFDSTGSPLMGLGAPGQNPKNKNIAASGQQTSEAIVHQKLRDLNKALTTSQEPSFERQNANTNDLSPDQPAIAKLEKMMAGIGSQDLAESEDPEMARLDSMLDKLLAIQQPGQNPDQSGPEPQVNKQPALSVTSGRSSDIVSLITPGSNDSAQVVSGQAAQTGFYGLEGEPESKPTEGITAVIENTQEIVTGATVQLRLTRPIFLSSSPAPISGFVYGVASLSGERLKIKISSLRSGEQILPVNLLVYDLDGLEGLYIPGALSRTVTKQALGSQVQGYDLDVGGASMGAQAASAGIQMSKLLLGRKTKLTQVTLRQGYKVLLKDANNINP
ncbi:Bacteroides conjugative transposon TraM protein [Dyadobacter soli]|uniref:Bacteroides conjugative transposon TraM protein n=1 Tax=Dyadobacter soli TaxID=659014 RepID=A0A1G7MIF4_9BACT|nr:conjugative transposon protein TraM [Dyadobacter soli]SDF60929.1 Bacteroides conjugative transposon TraM protein [Dyadobacter soli]